MAIQVPPDSTGKLVETNSPDGTTQRQVVTVGDKTTAANVLGITAGGAAKVDGSATTQPVSGTIVVSSITAGPASQVVTQGTGTNLHVVVDAAPTTAVTNAGLTNLDVALSTRTKPADQQHAIIDSGTTVVTQGTGTNLHTTVDNFPATQPVSGTVAVSNFPATQPVSGTVTANAGTNLNTSLLALDSTVAKDATLATIDTDIKASQPRAVTQVTSPWVVSGTVTPSNVSLEHNDTWMMISLLRQMLVEIRALRMSFAIVSGQTIEDDDIDTQIQ